MKVEILTRSYGGGIRPKVIWRGELAHVPRAGESVVVLDGYCTETVREIIFDLPAGVCYVYLETHDRENNYPDLGGN